MLNTYQQTKYNDFWEAIKHRGSLFFNSKHRAVGKTYLLNDIGLELQALGYRVFIISPCNCVMYYAEKSLSLDLDQYRGISDDKTVVLIDEVLVSEKFNEFANYCKDNQITTIGFIRCQPIEEFE